LMGRRGGVEVESVESSCNMTPILRL
jgi:hypothetical protein